MQFASLGIGDGKQQNIDRLAKLLRGRRSKGIAMSDNLRGAGQPATHTALLLVDVINDLEFPGGDKLLSNAVHIVEPLRALRERARRSGVAVIYANDNFGKWHSDFATTISHVCDCECRGKEIADQLLPGKDDFFILKPQLSAFHGTPLEMLLQSLQASHLILTGLAGNLCVLVTAIDAHMRRLKVTVPRDCMASETEFAHRLTIHQLEVLGIPTMLSDDVDFE